MIKLNPHYQNTCQITITSSKKITERKKDANICPGLLVARHHEEDGEGRHDSVTEVVHGEGQTHEPDSDEENELCEHIEVVIDLQSLQHNDDARSREASLALCLHL